MQPDVAFEQLQTPRLRIRRFTGHDAASFSAYRSDPDVARYQSWEAPYSVDQAQRFVAALEHEDPDTPGTWFQFALEETASAAHIGDVAASCDAADPRLASVGITLAPAAQGRGFGTEALSALIDYLFTQRGKHRVTADCDPRNLPSARLLERVGMRREAHHVRSSWWKGEWCDEYVYAVLAEEWALRPLA